MWAVGIARILMRAGGAFGQFTLPSSRQNQGDTTVHISRDASPVELLFRHHAPVRCLALTVLFLGAARQQSSFRETGPQMGNGRRGGRVSVSEVSRGGFREMQLVERKIGDDLLALDQQAWVWRISPGGFPAARRALA